MKIFFVTPYVAEPVHARLQFQLDILESNNIEYSVFYGKEQPYTKWKYLMNLFNFLNFRKDLNRNITKNKDFINCDLVWIVDMRMLTFAKVAKRFAKKVIYETLDDSVHLNFFGLKKKLPILRIIEPVIIRKYYASQRKLASQNCDITIVNSPNLLPIFDNKVTLLYYSSSLEVAKLIKNANNKYALVYFGQIDLNKGLIEMIDLSEKHNLTLFLFGPIRVKNDFFTQNYNIQYGGNHTLYSLQKQLEKLSINYNLIGCSIIHSENQSYALQEANKDIDYLALGVPFLVSHRVPSEEKVARNCAFYFDDLPRMNALLASFNLYEEMNKNCLELYQEKYCKREFESIFLNALNSLNPRKSL